MSLVEKSTTTLKDGGQAVCVRLKAERIGLDISPSDVKAALLEGIPHTARAVVLDLSDLKYTGTEFFAVLLGVQKRLNAQGQTLRICNVAPIIEESLRLCMLHKILNLYDKCEDALA